MTARDALRVKAGEEGPRGMKSSQVMQESRGKMSGGTNLWAWASAGLLCHLGAHPPKAFKAQRLSFTVEIPRKY